MKNSVWNGGILAWILIVGWAGAASGVDEAAGAAAPPKKSPLLKAMIEQRLAQIDAARAAEPEMFEIVEQALPLFAKPVQVPSARVTRFIEYLQLPLEPALLDRETRCIVERYPEVFQQVKSAAMQWLADADGTLQDQERFRDVESTYRSELAEIEVACTCPHNEFQALIRAAGPHNVQYLPTFDAKNRMAWEAVLLREDLSWSVKGQVLHIVLRFRDAESVPTLVALRLSAVAKEKKRDSDEVGAWASASVARDVVSYGLVAFPCRASLLELAEIAKEAHDPELIERGVVPPGMYLIGAELNRSEEWKRLLDGAEAEGELAESVGWLREAMRLTAGEQTNERD